MSDEKQNEQKDELRDLDVSEKDAEAVTGGVVVLIGANDYGLAAPAPPRQAILFTHGDFST
jgi:hypothetical protein